MEKTLSFGAEVKQELCRSMPDRQCCLEAECYGILLFCNTFTSKEIRIITGNRAFAGYLPRLFRRTFWLDFDLFPSLEQPGKLTFSITDPDKLKKIAHTYGHDAATSPALHVNFGVLEEDCCRVSFVRGAYLAGGSVTDPDKRYHLELATSHLKVGDETLALLRELNLSPKDMERDGTKVLYFKQSEAIVDFLTMAGAPVSGMRLIEAKVEKGLRNDVNRRCNCDNANLTKAVDAAQAQLAAIRQLRAQGRLENLPEKLRHTALLREEYPEATLSELAALCDPPVSKPALSHRMQKLIALVDAVPVGGKAP